jgi:protein SCO1/2
VLSIAAFAAGIYLAIVNTDSGPSPDIRGFLWPEPPTITSFELIDHEGTPFTLTRLEGKWSLLFFGFTHCPDVCPSTLAVLNTVHESLQDTPQFRDAGQVVFVSVDPDRDHATYLRAYIKHFNDAFVGATGPQHELAPFTKQLGILYTKVESEDRAPYSIDHSASVLLVDPAARLVGVFSPPHDASDIATRFKAITAFIDSRS